MSAAGAPVRRTMPRTFPTIDLTTSLSLCIMLLLIFRLSSDHLIANHHEFSARGPGTRDRPRDTSEAGDNTTPLTPLRGVVPCVYPMSLARALQLSTLRQVDQCHHRRSLQVRCHQLRPRSSLSPRLAARVMAEVTIILCLAWGLRTPHDSGVRTTPEPT